MYSAVDSASWVDLDARGLDWRRLVDQAVSATGTPCYVAAFSPVALARDRIGALASSVPLRSWLSFKTHPLPALAVDWINSGGGVEVVSESELNTIVKLGCPVDQLLVNGVAKHAWLCRYNLHGLRVHFDSLAEIDAVLDTALAFEWRVGVRCHVPDEGDTRDPAFGGQFGMSWKEATTSLKRLTSSGANLQSVHFHLGQRHHTVGRYVRAMNYVAALCSAAHVCPPIVDCGGSLPAPDDPQCDFAMRDLQNAIHTAEEAFPRLEEVWLENGRFMTSQSTVLAIRVLDIKERDECRYLICDGGRTNHALAADRRRNPLLPLEERPGATRLTTVCGPTCMTDDVLGRFELPQAISIGDVLVWCDAGAYHLPWETRFSHGLNAVVWYDREDHLSVVRHREDAWEWSAGWVSARPVERVGDRESV
jgi:diaminopimelate decarboxylase